MDARYRIAFDSYLDCLLPVALLLNYLKSLDLSNHYPNSFMVTPPAQDSVKAISIPAIQELISTVGEFGTCSAVQ